MKNVITFIVLAITLFIFTACSDSQENGQTTTKENKTLTIWQTETDPNAEKVLKEIIEDFKELNPNLDVELETKTWGELYSKLVLAMENENEPDLTHLQPFMVYSLYKQNKLAPIDEVIDAIGKDNIYPAIRDLQKFDGQYYGLAYAVGTTFYSYRKDLVDELGLAVPETWDEYINFVSALNSKEGINGTNLPGGSAFFIQVLFSEFVASNGGRLFDKNGNPTFTESEVLETLTYFRNLAENAPKDWTTQEYSDQFKKLINGKTVSVPLTFGRFTRQIEKDVDSTLSNPTTFAVMDQPVGPSGESGIATMDCEPWTLFASSDVKAEAKAFLKFFYQPENYLKYTLQVPVHLTPIIQPLAESDDYLNDANVKEWNEWQQLSLNQLAAGKVRPVLIINESDLRLPFLMELQGSNILSDMVINVASGKMTPIAAAQLAEEKALDIISRYKEQEKTPKQEQ